MSAKPSETGYSAREVFVALLRRALVGGAARPGSLEAAKLAIRSGADEELLVRSVMRHRVAAFLHPAIESGVLGVDLPVDFIGLCRQAYFTTLRRNIVAMDLGDALLTALGRRGLSPVPRGSWALLRGPSPLHPDPGERPIGALELAIRAEEGPEARDLARGFGFEARDGGPTLWKSCGQMDLALCLRSGTPAPEPTARLLDAAKELGRTQFRCWVGLLDIHRLVVAGGFSTQILEHHARKQGLARMLSSSLRLARSVLATPVPAAWRAGGHPARELGRVIPPALKAPPPLL